MIRQYTSVNVLKQQVAADLVHGPDSPSPWGTSVLCLLNSDALPNDDGALPVPSAEVLYMTPSCLHWDHCPACDKGKD